MLTMLTEDFQTGSLLHLLTVGACVVLLGAMLLLARHASPDRRRTLRHVIGWGCLIAWILNTAYWFFPSRFTWHGSLPLHLCNLANLVGAVAILRKHRLAQALIYFWGFSLCIWAFLTPTVHVGPARSGFWVFWFYHLFILLSLGHVVGLDRFRPAFRDLLQAAAVTLAYVVVIAGIDRLLQWNYGFLGPSVPEAPTPVDVLGPYPLRILWMIVIGTVIFALLWLPFRSRRIRG